MTSSGQSVADSTYGSIHSASRTLKLVVSIRPMVGQGGARRGQRIVVSTLNNSLSVIFFAPFSRDSMNTQRSEVKERR
jgi:hypothetical protein